MRFLCVLISACLMLTAFGCTTTPRDERPKIHCPACGTDLDAVFQKRF